MSVVTRAKLIQSVAALLLISLLASVAGAAVPKVPLPAVQMLPYDRSGATYERDVPFLAWYEDLSAQGYVEEEILMSGTANEYEYVDDAAQNPEVRPSGISGGYVTRVLIRHPANPADFNGVVYMEILNATANADGAPMWDFTWKSIIADGAAYVGVTYSNTTADFLRDSWGDPDNCIPDVPLPENTLCRDRSRYATVNVPTRAYTWDILNQAAAVLKADTDPRNPMQGFGVDTIIATGYSQSARYVSTFNNSFYPSYAEDQCTAQVEALDGCIPVVDGYLVGAGGSNASKLNGAQSHAVGDRRNCDNALNREMPCIEGVEDPVPADPYMHDLPKVVRFTTESELKNIRVRQTMADQPLLRTYEVAGTTHVDYWLSLHGQNVSAYQYGTTPTGVFVSPCDKPFNRIRTGIPLSAIQHRLARWIQYDEQPPPSHYMEWEGDFSQLDELFNPLVNWVRDDGDNDATDGDDGVGDGNAIGGVRPPRLNVPLGLYNGSNSLEGPLSILKINCSTILGSFVAYDAAELEARYTNRRTFVVLTWWNMYASYLDGFLLAVDAPTIMNEAKAFTGLPE